MTTETLQPVLVNMLLDSSGSMEGIKKPTISGVNEYLQDLQQQAKAGRDIRVSLSFFRCSAMGELQLQEICRGREVSEVPFLTPEVFQPGGGTPLYDAIAAILSSGEAEGSKLYQKRAVSRLIELEGIEEAQPSVLCVIITDGEENSSKTWTKEKIRKAIQAKEEQGWTFAYLGANQDAWIEGMKMGIDPRSSKTYAATAGGTQEAYRDLRTSSQMYLMSNAAPSKAFFQPPVNWKAKDKKDDQT